MNDDSYGKGEAQSEQYNRKQCCNNQNQIRHMKLFSRNSAPVSVPVSTTRRMTLLMRASDRGAPVFILNNCADSGIR